MTGFSSMATTSTAEGEAYRFILAGIRTARFKAGERLIPEEIATEIGMSRMPVREAFRRLATEGLVLIRPNRGCVVAGLTVEEIFEVFEMRSVLEGLAVRLAVPRLDADAFAELDRLLDRMERSGDGGQDWVARHREFHEYICSFANRPKLLRQIASLHVTIEPYLRIWFHHAAKPLTAREEHQAIIDSLRAGDAAAAEALMSEHILTTAPTLTGFALETRGGG
ncbi:MULTISPECIES: GntR family transcriptional regulator [Ancylobacter]|jgi:DNA-binding GntR family transcriptional regulator|uniref:GntR family transcriptional regulator n=1 Tax=Ancylobacter polymorphus TaxID=223390 RepID=A0A9E7A194_9HYPH|nr:GntR family transcriptional regulator [Ancylobacter polymorphus]UOK70678.1 GntR family transcriptional regulator [Ancylobacter polymorphus]